MDIRQTLPSVIISIILLLTGAGLCLNVKLKEGNIYGISGQSINLKATYLVESSNKLHSITWKVDKSGPTRILQYIINKNKTLTSTPYRNRIKFDSKTGSLILLDFTPSDQGTYQIIVTADDGAEDKASTEVTLYEPIEGITIIMAPNQTSSIRNVTLSCSVKYGTMPKFSWTKNGKSIMETESISLCNLGQSLTLHAFGLEDCGTYTCSVANRLNNQTYSLNLLASSNFPQCRVDLSTNKRQHYIIPILIVTFSTLLAGLVIYSTKVGKIALQKSRSK
ncbi:HEPACAM family member 2-like [Scyliorhinus canicula]|uniref:HEPACAM family member 2-like n=1 Tax=Scyliorhinus canicula TaxID=7830 RepID=UPI0018F28633|nr:HEPACAM family member 2-like [Scyliorhinus canicula]XP_038669800.1 HEPACAM family member 2-like [Scyliorhinus canicula]XP_038669801.1 HEPACAM family member 2-like [Scyliorhinus canicula]XP_038669802.1 HEPACAM family member 2-like [Scyliorhinus canicula]XP_038669803.1 HEPACAM family member 2-like [Scyliorhinus canicula]